MDTSYREHPKNRDRFQYSGSTVGEDQESKEVAEERSRVQALEGQAVVLEREVVE